MDISILQMLMYIIQILNLYMIKIEMSQYYFDCYYIRNNSKYNITFCRDAVSCLDQAYEWFSKRLLEI